MNGFSMPPELSAALEALTRGLRRDDLVRDAGTVSERYRSRTGRGDRLVTRESEAAAYALSRMPATLGAAAAALETALDCSGLKPGTVLDCGAGTGAMGWAAQAMLRPESILCLEREEAMRRVGGQLARSGEGALARSEWREWDALSRDPLPKAELVCEGYMLGELAQDQRIPAACRLWEAAEQMLLVIEPGTPAGFGNLRAIRKALTERGAYVAAPCPAGTGDCRMAEGDWCHFTVRVQRTKLHKTLKGGEAPYEDEKFCCMAFTRTPPESPCAARVLRHPQIAPGRIALTLCRGGETVCETVTKKDLLWKQARKIGAGDGIG